MPIPIETAALLSQIPLFAALSESEQKALSSHTFRKQFPRGATVFLDGEPCEGLFLIAKGSVKIYKSSPAGREIVLAIERAPSSIAEIPVFDGGSYPASAAAVDEVQAYFIPKRDFQRLCRQHPGIALKVLAVIGKRLRALVTLVQRLTFGSVRQRLAQALLEFQQQASGSPFELPVTHQELALRLGTVREVVSRNLSRFQAQGLIRIENRRISIEDPAGLRHEAETEIH